MLLGWGLVSCAIETKDENPSGTTLQPPSTGTTTTIPPDERPPTLADLTVSLSEIARYSVPLTVIRSEPGSESVFLGDPSGRIYEIKRDLRRNLDTGFVSYSYRPQTSPFLDISSQILSDHPDQGFFGFDFSTDGARLYVSYTNLDGNTRIDELRVSNTNVSPTSQRELLTVEQPDPSNNAGAPAIGPDGFLHIPLGDGGGGDDPFENAQNPETLLGSVLRIDPESTGETRYNIPFGNPYQDGDGLPEVYVIGLRHPAGLTHDPETRDLWIADRGGDGVQEITVIPWEGAPVRKANLGWSLVNGTEDPGDEPPAEYVAPIFQYGPDDGCEIVEGAVYRGDAIPILTGSYVFGDRCSGRILAIRAEEPEAGGPPEIIDWAILPVRIDTEAVGELGAIGTDADGELVVSTRGGVVYQLNFTPPTEGAPPPQG